MFLTQTALGAIAAMLMQEAPAVADQPQPEPQAAQPQPEQEAPVEDVPADEDTIVITGQLRGQVIGDVEPITTLDARDISATGARNVSELLEALAPEIGSNRGRGGGRPVLLVDGRRISGFRELRDLPSEAIERVEVLPEEVALSYGYRADQRVVNFVLRENFFSTTIEMEARAPTDGGRAGGEFEVDRLMLSPGKRTTFNFDYETDGAITEDERDVALQPIEALEGDIDPRPFRTLVGSSEQLQLGTVIKRPLGSATATINAEVQEQVGQSLNGPAVARFDVPADSPFADGTAFEIIRDTDFGVLQRDRRTRSGALAFIVNSAPGDWLWSSNGTLDVSETRTRTDRGAVIDVFQDRIDALDATFDPFGPLAFDLRPRDEALSTSLQAVLDGQLNGSLLELPAGDLRTTLRGGVNYLSIDSRDNFGGALEEVFLDRTRLFATANLDIPLLEESAIGDLGASLAGEVEDLSDFGTLTVLNAGLNWRPTRRFSLRGNYTREEGAPSLSQLGDPRTVEPLARVFDFTTGDTVFIPVTTGGNPDLLADTRALWSLGANWELPIDNDDLGIDLRADFVSARIENQQGGFPSVSPEIEAAFPDRFVRDDLGQLVAADFTPTNYARASRDSLRYGFTLRHSIAPKPPSAETIQRFRDRFRQQRQAQAGGERGLGEGRQGPPASGQQAAGQGQPQAEGQQQAQNQQAQNQQGQQQNQEQAQGQPQGQQQGRQGQRGGGGPRGFGGSQGPRGGRLWASVTHEITFKDDLLIAEGGPLLDYLDGDAAGGLGGRSRHKLEGRFGLFNNGWGARVNVDWQSATSVDTGVGRLDFDDYGTFDINLYANLGEQPDLLSRQPWLLGTSLQLGIDNVLNERPRVTDQDGFTPPNYQSALLRPEGRVIKLEIRKLFVPPRFLRQQFQRARGG
ncbi:TonB-dependent receptor plug domain-containing protein [Sphingomicrobium sp. XHP0235]|uniref:TonB-dependent receptor plug domain-containing protein n=1 Tax=Sphingomicrobium aquimarinum TaxID=3133971 RepID=UPI0031FEC370